MAMSECGSGSSPSEIECRQIAELLGDYFDGALPQRTVELLEWHVDGCAPCVAFMNTYKTTIAATRQQPLEQAQDAGKPVIVFVTASWCPNCRAQQPIVDTLTKDPAFSEAVLFVVDFDSDKQALRDLNVTMQSTLIAFEGKTERKRSTAVTDPEQIRTLF